MTSTDRNDPSAIRKTARMAGLLYLVMSILMVFGFMYLPRAFIVNGDPATTARKIVEGERMYRMTILASLASQVLFIFVVLNLYSLFRDVDRRLARVMATLVLLAIAADLVAVGNRMAPLDLLIGNPFLSSFTRPQLEALALGFLYLNGNLSLVLTAFWGLWLIPFGMLTIKSRYFPPILGVLLMIAGVAYIATSILAIGFPELTAFRSMLMPLYFGEVPIIFWLLIMGAKVPELHGEPLRA